MLIFLWMLKEIEWVYMASLEYMFGYLHGMTEWLMDAFKMMFMDEMMYYMNVVFFLIHMIYEFY